MPPLTNKYVHVNIYQPLLLIIWKYCTPILTPSLPIQLYIDPLNPPPINTLFLLFKPYLLCKARQFFTLSENVSPPPLLSVFLQG